MESQHQDRGRFHGTFRKHGYTHLPKGRSPRQAHRGTSKRPHVAQEGKRIEANRHQGTSRRTYGPARLNHPNPPPPERRQDTLKKTARGNHPEGRTSAEPRPRTMERQRLQRKRYGKKWEASPQAAALATHKGSRQPSGNRGGRTPKGEQPLSPLRAKPLSNIREAAVPEETRQVQDELNRRPANAATLNLNEAKSSKSKSLGDRASR